MEILFQSSTDTSSSLLNELWLNFLLQILIFQITRAVLLRLFKVICLYKNIGIQANCDHILNVSLYYKSTVHVFFRNFFALEFFI